MKKLLGIVVLGFLWFNTSLANNNSILPDGIYEFHWSYKHKGQINYFVFDIVKIESGKLEHLNIPCHRGLMGKYRKNLKYKLSKDSKKFSVSGIVNFWKDKDNSKIKIKFDKDKIKNFDIEKKPLKSFSQYGNYEKEEIHLTISKKNNKHDGDNFICDSEVVKFNSYSPKSAKEMLGGLKKLKKQKVYGNLYYPKTDKEKVPLIITIHPSTGFVPDHHFKFLNNLGIAVLDVQTFKSRGIDSQWEYIVSEEAAAIDAYVALDKISKDSRIDKNKVAVMGFSYGAMAVVNTHQKFFIDIIKPKNKFMAHIAYYPLCYLYKYIETSKAPLYIFIGEKDRLTPYEYCDDYSKKVIEGGGNSILKVFPEATHRFDWEKLKNPISISTETYTDEFISKTLDSSYPRYDIGKDVAEFTTPNGWSYFSLLSEENRKKKYKECCKIKRSLVEYNKNAASESNKIIKEIFDIK